MRSPEKIENVKKKIHAITRKMLQHGIGNFLWVGGSGRGKVGGSRIKFSGGERRAEGRVRLLRTRGSVELREVAYGFATQGLWLRNGKVRSQVSSIDRSRLPRRTVREIKGGGRRASDRAYTVFGSDLGEREEQVVCHASALTLAMTDEARQEAVM